MLKQFDKLFKRHTYPIAGTITDCYNQLPKQDAKELCITTCMKYFVELNLLVPLSIFILDEDQSCDSANYTYGTHDIEVILVFKVSAVEAVRINMNIGTLDGLIEHKKLINNKWCLVDNSYTTVTHTQEEYIENCDKSILDYCNGHVPA